MKAVKVGKDCWRIEHRHEDMKIRRVKTSREIAEFLLGGPTKESNLASGGEILFGEFADDHYLRLDAPRRMKAASLRRTGEMITALKRYFGRMPVHKISSADWDKYQEGRSSGELSPRGCPCGPSVLLKEFKCLRSVLSYAQERKFVLRNELIDLKLSKLGLFDKRRAEVWLKKDEIWRLLEHIPAHLRAYFEFLVWTGARPDEACQFGRDNISADGKEIWILNSKKRKKDGDTLRKRRFRVESLGPRFQALLQGLVPHPDTGLFFANPDTGQRYVRRYLQLVFKKAVEDAKLGKRITIYDCRGTFAWHRAMIVRSWRQLQSEMGHLDPTSIQNYLDETEFCDTKESIFYGVNASWEGTR